MKLINLIKAPIKEEIKEFENFFKSYLKTKVSLLDIIMNYIISKKGKQMRPILVFLSAKLNGKITKSTFYAASLIELLHTATLVHDDVVDESYKRRGFFSVNALWKNKVAVLIGDYLLAKGLLLATEKEEFELLKIVSNVVKEMSEGELLQIEKSKKLDINEEIYFEIIRKKTAILISACTQSGANSVNGKKEDIEKLKNFGIYLGMAFQIKDDLFDYQKTNLIGKPTGNDLKEKKLTLPIIFVLKNFSEKNRKKVIRKIKKYHNDRNKMNEIIEMVKKNGGLEYAEKIMIEYKNKAISILNEFNENDAKKSLMALTEYIVIRKK